MPLSGSPLCKPQYIFRPQWAIRRLLTKLGLTEVSSRVALPWIAELYIDTKDTLGRAIASQGVYDIVTTEVLWRLTEDGATVFDVGANIGYFTTLLANRVGPNGRVVAFEPHPETVQLLRRNVSQISQRNVQIENVALSTKDGEGTLDNFPNEESNTSYSFLTDKPTSNALTVKTARGDKYVIGDVALMKIDAQWHEAAVLEGFGEVLRAGLIRDIVFEEDAQYPAPSHKVLLDAGYKILWFDQRLSGPLVISPHERPSGIQSYEILPSFLATRDELRARRLLSKPGWQSLRKRSS